MLNYDTAMETAMENIPDIKRTMLNLERSRELLNAQNAALKSQFRLSLNPFNYSSDRTFNEFFSEWSSTETKSSNGTFTISQPIKQTDGTLQLINRLSWQDSFSDYQDKRDKAFSNSLYLNLNQPIFTYNRTKLQLTELELDLESTELTFALQRLALERQVASGFYNVYQAMMNLDVARDEHENQQQSYDIIKNKVDAGLAALEELYQAELNLANSNSTLQNREVTLQNSLDDFKLLLGVPLSEALSIDADVAYRLVDVNMDKALSSALSGRLELRQQAIALETSRFALVRTMAQNEFVGSINLSYGIIGTDEDFGAVYDAPTKKQSIGLSFEIPVWDWGEKESRIKASEASIQRQELTLEDEKNTIEIGIRKLYRSLRNLVTQIEIAEQSVKNAQLTYDINLERYRNGDLTSMDLSLYQNQLSQRRMGLVQALISYQLALLDLKIQSLWDFEQNESILPEVTVKSR